MNILSVNAGSSSLKLSLFMVKDDRDISLIVKSTISGLTSSPKLSYKNIADPESKEVSANDLDIKSDEDAFKLFLDHLSKDKSSGGQDKITHICHRVVHGGNLGEKGPAIVDDDILRELDSVTGLAPLHNGPALSILKICMKTLPHAVNIAFFDSSFHSSIPDFVKTYPIDQNIAKEKSLRKYGFHGISYAWILKNVAKHLDKPSNEVSIIALHLGSGASMCAIKNGKSYDTSMGLTPLEGLPGGTRSGALDPSLIFHFISDPTKTDEMPPSVHLSHAEAVLNSKCGFKALAGTSNFAEILAQDPLTKEGKLAIDIFLDRVLNFLGSYWLKLEGGRGKVDAFVFAGGIGEGSAQFREMVIEAAKGLGDKVGDIDKDKNKAVSDNDDDGKSIVKDIDAQGDDKVRLLVCMTDEQLQMAEECLSNSILKKSKS